AQALAFGDAAHARRCSKQQVAHAPVGPGPFQAASDHVVSYAAERLALRVGLYRSCGDQGARFLCSRVPAAPQVDGSLDLIDFNHDSGSMTGCGIDRLISHLELVLLLRVVSVTMNHRSVHVPNPTEVAEAAERFGGIGKFLDRQGEQLEMLPPFGL